MSEAAMAQESRAGVFDSVPVIDFADYVPGTGHRCVEALRRACCEVGTFYLANHNISVELQDALTSKSRRFFAEPTAQKEKFAFVNSPHWRGYNGLAQETTAGRRDMREQLEFGLERPAASWNPTDPPYARLHGPNQWPAIADDAAWTVDYRATVLQYIDEQLALSHRLAQALAEALELPADHFQQYFAQDPHIRMKIVQYPPQSRVPEPDSFGVGPHKDYGFFGLLLQDDVGGLQVQNADGVWLDVKPLPNTFVVSLGEMLEVATGGAFTATTHRVLVPKADKARLSVNYFYNPNPSATLKSVELTPELQRAKERWSASTFDGSENNVIYQNYGMNALKGMIRSHMDVATRHHSDLLPLVTGNRA